MDEEGEEIRYVPFAYVTNIISKVADVVLHIEEINITMQMINTYRGIKYIL